jgi:hypothetical protein
MKTWRHCLYLLICCSLFGHVSLAQSPAPNVITDWVTIVQPAVTGGPSTRPPGAALVLAATIQLAVYDAVMAIEGGYEPYSTDIAAPGGADVRAAAATAAYETARVRVHSSQIAYLDAQYTAYMAAIPDGLAKNDGIAVGKSAADAIIALRANDGVVNVVAYECSAVPPPPGEFEPNGGCGTQPVDVNLGQIAPFTFKNPAQYRPWGPPPLTSRQYAKDFIEARDYGRANGSFRTPEQTDIAYFWSEHAYIHWNRNLNSLALSRGLNVSDAARFFAMVYTAAADAGIAGFEAKYYFRYWRPRTALPRADEDGNRNTDADSTWTPLLTVNHPEYPSGHAFVSGALIQAVARFFRTNRVTWTIGTSKTAVPQLVLTERTYDNLNVLAREIDDARVWAGLHWRFSMTDGGQMGRRIAKDVTRTFFRPVRGHRR